MAKLGPESVACLTKFLQCLSGQGLGVLCDPGQRRAAPCALVSQSVEWFRCAWCQAHSLHHIHTREWGHDGDSLLQCRKWALGGHTEAGGFGGFPPTVDSAFLEVKLGLYLFMDSLSAKSPS